MKQKYAELVKTHSLPDLHNWLPLEDELTIRDVRAAFADKLGSFTELVYIWLNPEDVAAINEAELFEAEHETLQAFYHRLVLLSKDCLLADIASTLEEEAVLVKRLCKEWPAIIMELRSRVERTKEAYTQTKQLGFDTSYLG